MVVAPPSPSVRARWCHLLSQAPCTGPGKAGAALTPPGGYLFLGHSERLSGPAEAMYRIAGVTAYWRPLDERGGADSKKEKGGTA
jgi:hypothetical protein